MAGLLTFQSGPKGTKMVNLSVFDHLGPFWAHRDLFGPFQTKMNCLPLMDKVGFGGGASEEKISEVVLNQAFRSLFGTSSFLGRTS